MLSHSSVLFFSSISGFQSGQQYEYFSFSVIRFFSSPESYPIPCTWLTCPHGRTWGASLWHLVGWQVPPPEAATPKGKHGSAHAPISSRPCQRQDHGYRLARGSARRQRRRLPAGASSLPSRKDLKQLTQLNTTEKRTLKKKKPRKILADVWDGFSCAFSGSEGKKGNLHLGLIKGTPQIHWGKETFSFKGELIIEGHWEI